MILRIYFVLGFTILSLSFKSQSYKLGSELKEISGLELINDSLLVAHNDSGNSPHLFLIRTNGQVLKKILISNAKNVDWEDVAADDEYLYISDLGNNSNKRKDLSIYRVKLVELLNATSIRADVMQIVYMDQKAYPPDENDRNFDSECLISAYGDLWIFTKNNSKPFDGNSKVYRFKFEKDSVREISLFSTIHFGKNGYLLDTPTAGDFHNDKFYITTYNRLLIYELNGTNFKLVKKKKYPEYNQKEALTVNDSFIWVANEYNKVLGTQKIKRIGIR